MNMSCDDEILRGYNTTQSGSSHTQMSESTGTAGMTRHVTGAAQRLYDGVATAQGPNQPSSAATVTHGMSYQLRNCELKAMWMIGTQNMHSGLTRHGIPGCVFMTAATVRRREVTAQRIDQTTSRSQAPPALSSSAGANDARAEVPG
jgi:hypothetical protein